MNYQYAFAAQDHGVVAKQVSCLVGAGLAVKRSAISDCGWINKPLLDDRVGKRLISGGDVEIALRIRSAEYELWYTPKCQLMHIIPSRRTSQKYLIDINYGLGTSQLYGDTMLWPDSYPAWLVTSTLDAFKLSVEILVHVLKATIKRRPITEVVINSSFVRGKWTGIGRLLWMDTQKRQELLGSAKVATSKG